MPLELLLTLVIGGIAGLAALLHGFGYSAPLRFDDTSARHAWLRQYPDLAPRKVHLSEDRAAALVETAGGAGLVWAMGANATAHLLSGATLARRETGLLILLHDFAAPGLAVHLGPDARERWVRLIPAPDAGGASPP